MLGDANLSAFFHQPAAKVSSMIIPLERVQRWPQMSCAIGLVVFTVEIALCTPTAAQAPALSVDRLLQMSGPELEAVYRQGTVAGIPPGRVNGTAILAPGTRRNGTMARGTRLVWQGKIFDPAEYSAVNRFFGLPIVRAQVYQEQSWLDGSPALILDYSRTSRIYAQNRDEIRQIAPGLLLGLMYARTTPQPTLHLYFVLEVLP